MDEVKYRLTVRSIVDGYCANYPWSGNENADTWRYVRGHLIKFMEYLERTEVVSLKEEHESWIRPPVEPE